MERAQVHTTRKTTAMPKSKLYEPETGTCYNGFRQTLFKKQLTVAYVFSSKAPVSGGRLVNRVTGEQYQVKNVIPLLDDENVDAYELVLGHL